MKVLTSGGKMGVVEYVMREGKDFNFNEIVLIDGNPTITKKIINTMEYKENYKRFVLTFEGKPSNKKMLNAYNKWKKLYMDNTYRKEEYNILSVLHKDTENYHIHITIPNQNLITNTRLDAYLDKQDRPRMNEIRDYINLENGWQSQDLSKIKNNEPLQTQEEIINIWRKQHNQKIKPIRKEKQKTQALSKLVNGLVVNSIKNGNIENIKDIENLVNDFGNYTFLKQGQDTIKNFSYISIEEKDTHKKYRIKSEVYEKDYDYNEAYIELNLAGKEKDIFQKITPKKWKLRTQELEKVLPIKLEKIQKMNKKAQQRISNNTSKKSKEKLNDYYTNNRTIKTTNTTRKSPRIRTITKLGDTIRKDITRQEQANRLLSSRMAGTRHNAGKLKKGIEIMKKSKVEKLKQEINLAEYASMCGFTIKKSSKNGKSNVEMTNGNETIHIGKKPDGTYVYNDFLNGKGGSIIDFYTHYVNDKKVYWQVLNELEKYYKNPRSNFKYTLSKKVIDFESAEKEWDRLRVITLDNTYLTQERKIAPETINIFKDAIKQDTKNNICFIHKNYTYEDKRIKIDTCGIERKNYNGFKNHTNQKGLWGTNIGKNNDIFLFESPLDAMSCYELYKKDGMYISLGGSPSVKQLYDLMEVSKYTQKNITTCFDNDKNNKGQELAIKIKTFLSQEFPEREINDIKPILNDWNEELINKKENELISAEKLKIKLKEKQDKETFGPDGDKIPFGDTKKQDGLIQEYPSLEIKGLWY